MIIFEKISTDFFMSASISLKTTQGFSTGCNSDHCCEVKLQFESLFKKVCSQLPEYNEFFKKLHLEFLSGKISLSQLSSNVDEQILYVSDKLKLKKLLYFFQFYISILKLVEDNESCWVPFLLTLSRSVLVVKYESHDYSPSEWIYFYTEIACCLEVEISEESQKIWLERVFKAGVQLAEIRERPFHYYVNELDVIISLLFVPTVPKNERENIPNLKTRYNLFERKIILLIAGKLSDPDLALGLVCEKLIENKAEPVDDEEREIFKQLLNHPKTPLAAVLRAMEYCQLKNALDWRLRSTFYGGLKNKIHNKQHCSFEEVMRLVITLSSTRLDSKARDFWSQESVIIETIFKLNYSLHIHCLPTAGLAYRIRCERLDYAPADQMENLLSVLKFVIDKNSLSPKALDGVVRYLFLVASLQLSKGVVEKAEQFVGFVSELVKIKDVGPMAKIAILGFVTCAVKSLKQKKMPYLKLLRVISEKFNFAVNDILQAETFCATLIHYSSHDSSASFPTMETVIEILCLKGNHQSGSAERRKLTNRIALTILPSVHNEDQILKILPMAFPQGVQIEINYWQSHQLLKVYHSSYLSFGQLLSWFALSEARISAPVAFTSEVVKILLKKAASCHGISFKHRGILIEVLTLKTNDSDYDTAFTENREGLKAFLNSSFCLNYVFEIYPAKDYWKPIKKSTMGSVVIDQWQMMVKVAKRLDMDLFQLKKKYLTNWILAAENVIKKVTVLRMKAMKKMHQPPVKLIGKGGAKKYHQNVRNKSASGSMGIGYRFYRHPNRLPLVPIQQGMHNILGWSKGILDVLEHIEKQSDTF